jgi:hypothetical protein
LKVPVVQLEDTAFWKIGQDNYRQRISIKLRKAFVRITSANELAFGFSM